MKKGLLLPIFSLPSRYGIGDFGNEAFDFIDILKANNIDYWEILPINACCGKYPYSPVSYYALNTNYISLDKLYQEGLITKPKERKKSSTKATYDDYKETYYKEAYKNFKENEDYLEFKKKEKIIEYADFMCEKTGEEKDYYIFLQYILDKQYKELKKYANDNNVKIIGDMPIYPDFDSVEVKYNSKYYDLVDGKMEYVSGAPPDYFSEDGQKWGHPLYNFDEMKKDNYAYLIDRYKEYLDRFDIIRIDHFKAYEAYYKIPIDKTAKEGFYVEGPKEEFFDELFKYTTSDRFIVEDLGDITRETEKLRDKYHFTKMKILQYSLNLEKVQDEYKVNDNNFALYPGNHDNNTIMGWYKSLNAKEKIYLVSFLKNNKCNGENINQGIIEYCLKSNLKYVIIPVQDVLGLDEKSRINTPSKEQDANNWCWKLKDFRKLKDTMDILK